MKSSRAEAIRVREKQYYTGKPCKNGHDAPRDTITAECVECRKGWGKIQRDKVSLLRKELKAHMG